MQVYLHLVAHPPGPAWSMLSATRRAGQATALMARIAGHGQLSYQALLDFARFGQLDDLDLRSWVMPALADQDVIELRAGPNGDIIEIEERVGVTAKPLDVTARLLAHFGPSAIELCAVDSADLATTTPLTSRDHRDALISAGHDEDLHERAFSALGSIGVMCSVHSSTLGDDVVYSPQVWGSEAVDIAGFMGTLPSAAREQLTSLTRQAMSRPGLPVANLGVSENLLAGARKVGLVAGARVHTAGHERVFVFPADLDRRLFGGKSDIAHQRKLFTAHILNGHYYAPYSAGRIRDPVLLVERLIERGTVGPATSIAREYPLLESAGIVRTREAFQGRRYLDLVQRDVAVDSLELIKRALDGSSDIAGNQDLSSLWLPGSFAGPEVDRRRLDVARAGAEMELMEGAVLDLREHLRRRNRGEDLI